jgi:hypothetical protein
LTGFVEKLEGEDLDSSSEALNTGELALVGAEAAEVIRKVAYWWLICSMAVRIITLVASVVLSP